MSSGAMGNVAVPQDRSETTETRLLRSSYKAEGTRRCPIALQQAGEVPAPPEGAPQKGKETGEAMLPAVNEGQEAQEHIDQQGCPDLPAYRIGAMAEEIRQLQGLLDLFEEGLDRPAVAVKVGNAGRTPFQVVGQKDHLLGLAVDFHQGGDAAHHFGIVSQGRGCAQDDDFVAQNAAGHRQGLENFIGHVLLGTSHPEDAPLEQVEEVGKVQIRLVENDNLPGADGGTEFARAFGIVLLRRVDDGKARKKAVEIQSQMTLGRSLAPAVLGPVQAGGDELDGRRVHHVNGAAKAPGHSLAPVSPREVWLKGLQMAKHRPEDLLGKARVALLVGMGKIIAARRRGCPQRAQRSAVQPQGIANVVEPDGVCELGVDQADQMAPRREGARFFVHTDLSRQLRHQIGRNQIANLPQHSKLAAAWCVCLIHPCRVTGPAFHAKPFSLPRYGTAVIILG
jgi:hypothetical protein